MKQSLNMKCTKCGEEYTEDDLRELREMGEQFSVNPFICPDCYDVFSRKCLEDQFNELMQTEGKG